MDNPAGQETIPVLTVVLKVKGGLAVRPVTESTMLIQLSGLVRITPSITLPDLFKALVLYAMALIWTATEGSGSVALTATFQQPPLPLTALPVTHTPRKEARILPAIQVLITKMPPMFLRMMYVFCATA
jgi:hypothetical protein